MVQSSYASHSKDTERSEVQMPSAFNCFEFNVTIYPVFISFFTIFLFYFRTRLIQKERIFPEIQFLQVLHKNCPKHTQWAIFRTVFSLSSIITFAGIFFQLLHYHFAEGPTLFPFKAQGINSFSKF